MNQFALFAKPWWVNLLILVPFAAYYWWRKEGLTIPANVLAATFLFGMFFGIVEASVVVYLRAAVGLIAGYDGTIPVLGALPENLMAVEILREAATIVMLLSVAILAVKSARERWAVFLWTFAVWDIFYYVGLWLLIRWPSSLLTPDVLFLIPVPWLSQVWYPLLVSVLVLIAVGLTRKIGRL